MQDELQRLRQAARQLIETDRVLAGEALAPGTVLPAQSTGPARPAEPVRPASASTARAIPPPPDPKTFTGRAKRKAAELKALEVNEVLNCTRCGLCRGRKNVVFGEGNPDADLVFIGEGPGEEEDKQGRPFVGRAGELLTKMIRAMGLRRADVYICNVIKCRAPGNRAPLADEVAACWDHLAKQLKIIHPKVIAALGNPATHALLHTTTGITRLRGQWQSLPMLDADLAGIKVMPTFHPAYLLRAYTPDNRKKVWSDLQEVMRELGMPSK